MKEREVTQPKTAARWPEAGTVPIDHSVDFVYVMRKDGDFAMTPVAKRMSHEYNLSEADVQQWLLEEYDAYFARLADTLQWGFAAKGSFELHIYDPDSLDKKVREKAGGFPIVSLDPLMSRNVLEHKVSRGYYLGGQNDFGQVARPGCAPLTSQAQDISRALHNSATTLVEDDVFSGGSVTASIRSLQNEGVTVNKLIPGIQVGTPTALETMGVEIDPVVIYTTQEGVDIFDKVDLGDPRDYLLGASGLVIKMPSGNFGRAPYILPFVSAHARAGIPQEMEREFSHRVLNANLTFFTNAEEKIGKPILLKNMDPGFVALMHEQYGFEVDTPMDTIVTWSMYNLDRIWEVTESQGEFQKKLDALELPKKIIFIDVNGTMIPEGSTDGFISLEEQAALRSAVCEASRNGISVGLCSDSPLPQLQEFAHSLGIQGPILAENGNVIYHNDKYLILQSLDSIPALKTQITALSDEFGFTQSEDSVAPEFGGSREPHDSHSWSFGANRIASVTVFGPPALINHIHAGLTSSAINNVDASPQHGYLAIHPGPNYRVNKGRALDTLSVFGHSIMMIGNSISDWVDPARGVRCAFVSNAALPDDIALKAAYISERELLGGVIDIIEKVL